MNPTTGTRVRVEQHGRALQEKTRDWLGERVSFGGDSVFGELVVAFYVGFAVLSAASIRPEVKP